MWLQGGDTSPCASCCWSGVLMNMASDSLLTLRALLEHPSPCVASNANVIAQHFSVREEMLDNSLDQLVATMVQRRLDIPDISSELSRLDQVLVPLLGLHRTVQMAQPVEEQLEPSELDLMCMGISMAELESAARTLGCMHLGVPQAEHPSEGVIKSSKQRVIVVRTVTIRKKTLSVAFILDIGAPVSFFCPDTLAAFGLNVEQVPGNYVRTFFEGCVAMEVYLFSKDGPHKDYNVLGMDYMVLTNAVLQIDGRRKLVKFTVT